ncbi:MAG: elongation factor G [Candidatus Kapabacteria bacterium]|nr:elongation factor G [Candidatus Kapabacteria bacterium]
MKSYDAHHLRNVAILGHAGSGKTSLAECMLYESEEIPRRGSIEERTTTSDFHEIEHERQASVFASPLVAEWRDYKINIIDTPGYADYIGEVVSSMRVVDTSIMVVAANHGVEVGTEALWKYTERFRTPVMFVVNKVDHEHADFWRSVDQIHDRFGREAVVVQYPLVQGAGFNTIVDVLTMTAYVFPPHGGKPEKMAIPEQELERANRLHNELVEIVAENDETLMDHYLERGNLDVEEMRQGLTLSLIKRQIFPIFCVSAKLDMGAGRIMSFIDIVVPAPVEMPAVATMGGTMLTADPTGKPCIFVYRSSSEANTGDMSYFRVYSGTITHGMDLVNEQTGVTERIGQLYVMNGKKRIEVPQLEAGDLGATVKLKNTHVNNTLHEKGLNLVLPAIDFPAPKVRTAVVLAKNGEEDKLGMALHHLQEEDPTLIVEHAADLHQIILHGQGDMHLQAAKHRLASRFKLDVNFVPARIPYQETIRRSINTEYRHKKQTGGAGQFAEVHMRVEPYVEGMGAPEQLQVRGTEVHDLPWGGKLVYCNCIVGGVIDQRFMPAILKGVMEKMQEGPITGSHVRDIRVSVFDGKMHPVDSSEAAFKTAGRMAFKEAFIKADPMLLEPIYTVDITVPEELTGDVMSDLPLRRGMIEGVDVEGHYQRIKVLMPLAELDTYATVLRSMTQGRASYTSAFSVYQQVPSQLQQKLHADYVAHAQEEA